MLVWEGLGGTVGVSWWKWDDWILGFVLLFGGDVRLVGLHRRFGDLSPSWSVVPWMWMTLLHRILVVFQVYLVSVFWARFRSLA